jgi:hypothetical protein
MGKAEQVIDGLLGALFHPRVCPYRRSSQLDCKMGRAGRVVGNMPRFSLRFLLLFVAASCLLLALTSLMLRTWMEGGRAGRLRHFQSLLSNDPRIEHVSIGGYDEEFGLFDVTTVRFKIRGKPDSSIVLFVPNGETDLESLSIYQIGNLSLYSS